MFDLNRFSLRDMTTCGVALRKTSDGAKSVEEVAGRIISYLHDNLLDGPTGDKACVLARFFLTHDFAGLPQPLQRVAVASLGTEPESPALKCLVLLASAGLKPEWNARELSQGHQAISLPSVDMIQRTPMIARLLAQLGVKLATVVRPDPDLLMDLAQHNFNVFHVPEAKGSPFLPAQEEFVAPYGVRSVVGFGGLLPTGSLFVVILFTKVNLTRETAELFKPLAINAKLALLPFAGNNIFA